MASRWTALAAVLAASCKTVFTPGAVLQHCGGLAQRHAPLLALATFASTPMLAEAKSGRSGKRSRRSGGGRSRRGKGWQISGSDVCFCMIMFAGTGGTVVGWCLLLEQRPSMAWMRIALVSVTLLAMSLDFVLTYIGMIGGFFGACLQFMSLWGSLDAAIRFPVSHELDHHSSWKQIALLVARPICYCYGFADGWNSKLWFLAVCMVQLLIVPLLYFISIPLEPTEEDKSIHNLVVEDVDIFWRIGRFLTTPARWYATVHSWRVSATKLKTSVFPTDCRTKAI